MSTDRKWVLVLLYFITTLVFLLVKPINPLLGEIGIGMAILTIFLIFLALVIGLIVLMVNMWKRNSNDLN